MQAVVLVERRHDGVGIDHLRVDDAHPQLALVQAVGNTGEGRPDIPVERLVGERRDLVAGQAVALLAMDDHGAATLRVAGLAGERLRNAVACHLVGDEFLGRDHRTDAAGHEYTKRP